MSINTWKAMEERHTVRKFKDEPLSKAVIDALQKQIDAANNAYGTGILLITNRENAINPLVRLLMTRNVKNYFILGGKAGPDLDVRIGEASTDLMLACQKLGLNTWFVGGTWNHKPVMEEAPDEKVLGILAVGYGENQGKPHKSKTFDQVCHYEGEMPQWFVNGVRASMLAPTALNKQAYMFSGKGDEVSLFVDDGTFSGVDRGILMRFFELGAGRENFHWKENRPSA